MDLANRQTMWIKVFCILHQDKNDVFVTVCSSSSSASAQFPLYDLKMADHPDSEVRTDGRISQKPKELGCVLRKKKKAKLLGFT